MLDSLVISKHLCVPLGSAFMALAIATVWLLFFQANPNNPNARHYLPAKYCWFQESVG